MPSPGIARAAWRPEFFGSCVLDLWADLIPGTSGTAISTWSNAASTLTFGDFKQATGSKQPTIQRNIQNGKSGVLFNGTSSILTSATFAPVAGPCSIYTVFKMTTAGGNAAIYNFADSSGGFSFLETLNVGGFEPYSFASGFASGTIPGIADTPNTNAHILSIRFNNGSPYSAASYIVSLDGVAKTVVAGGSVGFSSSSSLGARSSGLLFYPGYLMRSLYFTANLSTANDAAVVQYLRNYFNI